MWSACAVAVQVPVAVKSLAAAGAAACWRIILTPIDTFKTTRQVIPSVHTAVMS